jgi:hypothetical protein
MKIMHDYESEVTCAKDKTGAWRYLYLYQAKDVIAVIAIVCLCKGNNMAELTFWIFVVHGSFD